MKKLPATFEFLPEMYRDTYFPRHLVDKIGLLIQQVVTLLETGERDTARIQAALDRAVEGINELQDEFEENDSELETTARESIADTIYRVLEVFEIKIDLEEAIRMRDW